MNTESPVTLHKITYRGVAAFQLTWQERGVAQEKSFPTEAEAVVEMGVIETRLRETAMAGKGLTVNPFGAHIPFINSKDVHFAALKLQPKGLKFRESIEDYVAAAAAVKGSGLSVADAARQAAEATAQVKPFEVTLAHAIYEWVELKKLVGDRPLSDLVRAYKQVAAAQPPTQEGPAPVAPAPVQ
jgi:hypothetical protein